MLHALNQPLQSDGRTQLKTDFMASAKRETFLIFSFRNIAFIFDHIFSIGLKSGLYGGRYKKRMLALCKTSATFSTGTEKQALNRKSYRSVQSVNSSFRKVTKEGSFPSSQAPLSAYYRIVQKME